MAEPEQSFADLHGVAGWLRRSRVRSFGQRLVLAIAFMSPDHPSKPPGPEKFNGQGMFFTLQVNDATAEFENVKGSGARIAYELRDEPWGQRRFGLVDPSGTWVDVVQQIEPAPGFWDPYLG